MIFEATPLDGVWVLRPERFTDDRGFFARTFCQRELGERGLETRVVQCSLSYNRHRGTLRGMHWQAAPHREVKLVRCTRGAVWDVALDLRPGSPSYRRHFGLQLDDEERLALYVPEGVAHGFLTLTDDSEVFYQMSEFYAPDAGRGVRWDDPAFGIAWPEAVQVISERDASYPDFAPEAP